PHRRGRGARVRRVQEGPEEAARSHAPSPRDRRTGHQGGHGMSDHEKEDLEKKRELLERAANRTRERLVETLNALDDKRHELTDVKGLVHDQVVEHKKPILITGGSIVLAVSSIVGWSIYRFATRKERLREERWKALRRYWNHPERLARKDPPNGSLAAELGRKKSRAREGRPRTPRAPRTSSLRMRLELPAVRAAKR